MDSLDRLVAGFKSSHDAIKALVHDLENTGRAKDSIIQALESKNVLLQAFADSGEALADCEGEAKRARNSLSRSRHKLNKARSAC